MSLVCCLPLIGVLESLTPLSSVFGHFACICGGRDYSGPFNKQPLGLSLDMLHRVIKQSRETVFSNFEMDMDMQICMDFSPYFY